MCELEIVYVDDILQFYFNTNLYIYKSSVHVFIIELLLNGWTDSYDFFCVYSRGFENG